MASLQEHTGLLGRRLAAHLLRRCTYAPSKEHIDEVAAMTVSNAVDTLFFLPQPSLAEPIDYDTKQPWINSGIEPLLGSFNQRKTVQGWWANEAFKDPGIGHKLMFFLHQNFVISSAFNSNSRRFFDYLGLLRHYVFGSYRQLAAKMTVDSYMLDYLDGEVNTKNSPNENYAREFFELFTIGKGAPAGEGDYTNYTEEDIVTAARLLSGWKKAGRPIGGDPNYIDPDTNLQAGYPNFGAHDTTDKTFSVSAFQGQTITGAVDAQDMYRELDDFVNMIFIQEETAKSICRRLYRYFVHSNITTEVETDIITPLANTMRDNDYNLEITLKQLLKSQHFYDKDDADSNNEIIGGLLKSPLDLLGNIIGFFKVDIVDPIAEPEEHYKQWWRNTVLDLVFARSGFTMFEPSSVAGYPAYYQEPGLDRNWLTGSTILARYKLPEMLLTGDRLLTYGDIGLGMKLDAALFLKDKGVISNNFDAYTIVSELTSYLFPEEPNAQRFDYYLNGIFLKDLPAYDWTEDWIHYLNTGDDSAVKIALEGLILTILYAQEFQVM